MPYRTRIGALKTLNRADAAQIIVELDTLRAELDDMRAKYTALRALLAAGTALGAGYNTGTGLNAATFTKN